MELKKGKLIKALRKGLRYFKKVNNKCKVKFYKEDKFFGSVDFDDSIYNAGASLMVSVMQSSVDNSWWVSLEMGVRKNLAISDNDFNYKHKNFFIKKGGAYGSYQHGNFIGHEEDLTTILKTFADNMLKGDLYQEWK